MKQIKIKLEHPKAIIPTYGSEGAACFDLYSVDDVLLHVGQKAKISIGISMEFPINREGQIRPRSRLFDEGIEVTFGTIDSDYRGIVKVQLKNKGNSPYKINPGDRIAQMKISKVKKYKLIVVEQLSQTERGRKGFGSTGI